MRTFLTVLRVIVALIALALFLIACVSLVYEAYLAAFLWTVCAIIVALPADRDPAIRMKEWSE